MHRGVPAHLSQPPFSFLAACMARPGALCRVNTPISPRRTLNNMGSSKRPSVTAEELSSWCSERLGAPVRAVLFESGYSSAVFGVVLLDGRHLVVKVRAWHERLMSCWQVQQHLWESGFRCPEPLGPPHKVRGFAVSFENYVAGGKKLQRGRSSSARLARVLAQLVQTAPPPAAVGPLEPELGFLRWAHSAEAVWPPATDVTADLNRFSEPAWIEEYASRLRAQLTSVTLPAVVGHGDWWSENVRWRNGELLAVDDWDSLVALPEPAIAGVAAALFADGASTIEESAIFMDSYVAASNRPWSGEEIRIASASGLWARLFDARKETTWGAIGLAAQLHTELKERAIRSGLITHRLGHDGTGLSQSRPGG